MLWLDPSNPATFPEGLLDALEGSLAAIASLKRGRADDTFEDRLRVRMRAEALRPLTSLEDDEDAPVETKETARKTPYSEEDVAEAEQFLRLPVRSFVSRALSSTVDLVQFRRKTGSRWCWSISDADIAIVSGVGPNTRTRRIWKQIAQARMKRHTTDRNLVYQVPPSGGRDLAPPEWELEAS